MLQSPIGLTERMEVLPFNNFIKITFERDIHLSLSLKKYNMKNQILYKTILFLGIVFLFSACQKEEIQHQTQSPKVTFSAIQNASSQTRATDRRFEVGDEIGIYVVKYPKNTTGILKSSGNYADNRCYRIDNNGNLQADGGLEIYMEQGYIYDFYAYYPYSSSISNATQFTFTVSNLQGGKRLTKSDFMLASMKGVSDPNVILNFQRKMAMIETYFQKIPGKDLGAAYMIGVKNSASVNLATGSVTTNNDSTDIVMHRFDENEYYTIIRCIVPVQTIKNEERERFAFDLPHETIRYRATSVTPLSQGAKSVYVMKVQYKVNANIVWAGGGTNNGIISGTGIFNHGETATLTVPTAVDYELVGWYLSNGKPWSDTLPLLSSENPYTFEVTNSMGIIAVINTKEHLITTVASDDEALIITPTKKVAQGSYCMVRTVPKWGYIFSGWYENGLLVSTNKEYTFLVMSPRTLEARFRYEVFWITSTPEHNAEYEGGSVFGGGVFMRGDSCKIEATAKWGYDFKGWYENGKLVTSSPIYRLVVTTDRHLEAKFSIQYHYVRVNVEGAPSNFVTGGGNTSYPSGTKLRLEAAMPGTHYFNGWFDEQGRLLTSALYYGIEIWESRTITARYTKYEF